MELTPEIIAQLSAPVPADQISVKNQGGASIKFTSDKFVMHRFDQVLGKDGWSEHYIVSTHPAFLFKSTMRRDRNGNERVEETYILGQITCELTIGGVTKSGIADMESNPTMYGTPSTNAQARAFKRAAMKFGVAAELWEKDLVADDQAQARPVNNGYTAPQRPERPASAPSAPASAGPTPLSQKQSDWLHDGFLVPTEVLGLLTGGRGGTGSAMVDELKEAKKNRDYNSNADMYIGKALTKLGISAPAAAIPAGYSDDEDED